MFPSVYARKAFTLIEVVIVLFIVALMGTISTQILRNSFELKEVISKKDSTYHESRLVISKMTNELSQAFVRWEKNKEVTNQVSDTVFMGEDNGDRDTITFNSFSHFRYLKDKKESDQNKIMYYTEENEEGVRVLYRKEMTHFSEGTDDEGISYPLLTGVTMFNLEYCDGTKGEWRNAWSSQSIEYTVPTPMAVSLKLEIAPNPENEESRIAFRALIPIEWELQRTTGPGEIHKACEELE